MFSGEEMERRASSFEQDSTSTEELEIAVQGGKRRQVQLGDQHDAGEEFEAFDADSRKLGERSDYFINIGSTIIKVGSVKSNLQRHG